MEWCHADGYMHVWAWAWALARAWAKACQHLRVEHARRGAVNVAPIVRKRGGDKPWIFAPA
eukprot:10574466-Lingulodinium_polyedra.AAC.1